MSATYLPPQPEQPAKFDFARPFTYVFEDPNWIKKVLIGGLFYLAAFLIIGAFFLMGYLARLIRNVGAGVERPLPEWEDLGGMFGEGLKLFVVSLVYMLPIFLLVGVFVVPAAILGGTDHENVANLMMSGMTCLIVPIALLISLVVPAALLRVIHTGSIASGFQIGEVFGFIKRNTAIYVMAILVHLVGNFASQFGIILCCVGVIFTAFWSLLVTGHAFGQLYRLEGP
jgi:hypothetical protein